MANRIVLNNISYHGKGAIQEIPGLLKDRGFQKAIVCSDPDLIKFGVTAKVTDLLDAAGFAYEIYSDIKPNPTIENVQSGVAAFQNSGAVLEELTARDMDSLLEMLGGQRETETVNPAFDPERFQKLREV